MAKDNIDCPNGIISSTKNFYLGISKGHFYNIFRFHTFMFKSSCKTGAMNKTVWSQWQPKLLGVNDKIIVRKTRTKCIFDCHALTFPTGWKEGTDNFKANIFFSSKALWCKEFQDRNVLTPFVWHFLAIMELNFELLFIWIEMKRIRPLWNNYNDIKMKHIKIEIETIESIKTSG